MVEMALKYILLIVLTYPLVFGRKCWHCKNARSNSECLRKGRLEQCLPNQNHCQNEVRAIAGGRFFQITKRCKQANACNNNRKQNSTGYSAFQCDAAKPHSVCRCCCNFDNCNGPSVACPSGLPACSTPSTPNNGFLLCPDRPSVGSYCFYKCTPGFKLVGHYSTQCRSSGLSIFWTNEPPQCIVEPCRSLIAPNDGEMTCTNDWNIGSQCTFSCGFNHVLVGQGTLRCSIFSTWSAQEPICSVVTCLAPAPLDRNYVPHDGECSDGYNYGSICTFTCHPDYDMVGSNQVTCGPPVSGNSIGTWDRRTPSCQLKTCQPAYCPSNQIDGICTTDCNECEVVEGSSSIRCTRNGWTGAFGVCVSITCAPPPESPENGSIQCSSVENRCGSSCTYSCNAGYRMIGNPRITCLETSLWNGRAPICEPSECDRIIIPGISTTCSDGVSTGSLCKLSCSQPNHELVGQADVTCTKEISDVTPVWEPGLTQYCRPFLCSDFPREGESPNPDIGNITCGLPSQRVVNDIDGRDGWVVDTQCNLMCNENYRAKGLNTSTVCAAPGVWTKPLLCCVRCAVNTYLDVVVYLDTTEQSYWLPRLRFLGTFLEFMAFDHSFNLNVTFIPFGQDLDFANQIPFTPIDDDLNEIDPDFLSTNLTDVETTIGGESNSGKALQYALDNIFGFHNYRVPVIFLFTTKAPSDILLAEAAAEKLRERQIHLRIFPVTGLTTADASSSRDIFLKLVDGNSDYVIERSETEGEDEADFFVLANEELITVTRRFCRNSAEDTAACEFI